MRKKRQQYRTTTEFSRRTLGLHPNGWADYGFSDDFSDRLHSQVQRDGTVVAAHGFVADLAVAQAWHQRGGQQEVVEPPAHVLGAGVHHVGPEGVGVGLLWVELAEAVHEAGRQQLAEAFALLWGKPRVLLVPFWVLQVDLLVGYIEVAAKHQRLLYVQLSQVSLKVHVPGFAVIQADEASAGIGNVRRHQEEGGELGGDDAALFVMLLFACRIQRSVIEGQVIKKSLELETDLVP